MNRAPEPLPLDLAAHLDAAHWDLSPDPQMLHRVQEEIAHRRRRRRRVTVAAVAASAAVLLPLGGLVVAQLSGPDPASPAGGTGASTLPTASPRPAGDRVTLDGWSVAVPPGCVQQGDVGSMDARFGSVGLVTDEAAAQPRDLRVELSTAMLLCGSTRLSIAHVDPIADPAHPGPAPLTADSDREEVLRVMAGASLGTGKPVTGALDRPRTSVWDSSNGLAVVVPDPQWGMLEVEVGGGDPETLMDVAGSARRE
ncbi:MAG TPA: hypothetical protein VES93_04325 [Ornithinibacter sp.]|nr:hypothetical protein [Ornithinibacter sp.]